MIKNAYENYKILLIDIIIFLFEMIFIVHT